MHLTEEDEQLENEAREKLQRIEAAKAEEEEIEEEEKSTDVEGTRALPVSTRLKAQIVAPVKN